MRRPVGVEACPFCGTPTPEWYEGHPPRRSARWGRLLPAGVAAVAVGILLPASAGIVDDTLVILGALALLVHALRTLRDPG